MEIGSRSWFWSDAHHVLGLWLFHMLLAVFLSSPIVYFGRKRARWNDWELLAFVVPFGVWLGLMFSDLSVGKSLANLGEAIYLSLAIPVAAMIRVPLGGLRWQQMYSAILLVALCCVGVGLFFLNVRGGADIAVEMSSWFSSFAYDFLPVWLMHLLPAVLLSAPIIYFGSKRARWKDWELLAFIVPCALWIGLGLIYAPDGKSLANLLVETACLSLAIPVAALIRVPLGGLRWQQFYSALLLLTLCCVGVGLYFFVPSLPE